MCWLHVAIGNHVTQSTLAAWAATLKEAGTRVIYMSVNVQDASKKPKQFKAQGREWSLDFIRAVVAALRSKGVEVLDTSSMTDPEVHGNVHSEDGTHVWGFVDVMKAKVLLSAICP